MRHKKLEIPEILHGKRADIAISELLGNELSRNQVKDLIKSGDILINDEGCKPKDKSVIMIKSMYRFRMPKHLHGLQRILILILFLHVMITQS